MDIHHEACNKATMKLFPDKKLYTYYLENYVNDTYSPEIRDTTKRTTLENMNHAISFCEKWDRFLDVGAGSGHYSTALTSYFKEGVLIEPQHYSEHDKVSKIFPRLTIIHSTIEHYTEDKKFDFILLADLFEHIEDIRSFAKKLSLHQDHGGVIYLTTPNPIFCGPAIESGIYFTRHDFGHRKHYTLHEIENIMSDVGYRLELLVHEEAGVRAFMRRMILGVSRRENSWKNIPLYRIVRPLVLFSVNSMVKILGTISHLNEKAHRDDRFETMNQCLVFKKI